MTRFARVRNLSACRAPVGGAEANLGQRLCGACGTSVDAVAERRLAEARWVTDPAGRVSGIEDAGTELRVVGSPYHLALALLDLADAQLLAGKDPSDVIAEAATIGETLRSPQVVERAESLRPRLPGDARTAP